MPGFNPSPSSEPADEDSPIEEAIEAIVEADDPATIGDPAPPPADDELDAVPVQPAEGEALVVAATSDGRFVLGSWDGIDQYKCAEFRPNGRPCRYDTLDGREFEEHWLKVHAPPPPPRPQPSILVDANGAPLT